MAKRCCDEAAQARLRGIVGGNLVERYICATG